MNFENSTDSAEREIFNIKNGKQLAIDNMFMISNFCSLSYYHSTSQFVWAKTSISSTSKLSA